MASNSLQNKCSVNGCFKWVGGLVLVLALLSWGFLGRQASVPVKELNMLAELMQTEAWILILVGQNPVELPLPIKELWDPAAAFNWVLCPLPALENLDLEG